MKFQSTDFALLLVRVGLGLVFIAHGWDKLQGMDGTVAFFGSLGLSAFWAYAVAWAELLGGIAVLLGLWTNWAGIILAITMLGAIYFAKFDRGFLGGYEFDLVLFLSAIAVAVGGPGKWALRLRR